MADSSTRKNGSAQTKVTEAVHVRFVPIDDVEPIQATISRKTAEELLVQLQEQLGQPGPADSAR